jgi:hypothetical protein
MPPFQGQVSEDEMVRLISFIKGLRDARDYPPLLQQADPPEARDQTKEKDKGGGKDKKK